MSNRSDGYREGPPPQGPLRSGMPEESPFRQPIRRSGTFAPARPALPASITLSPGGSTFEDDRDYPAVLICTALWYVAAVAVYAIWAAIAGSSGRRGTAFHAILSDAPYGAGALALSLVLAALLRRMTLAWRPLTAGLAASIVGAGLLTLVITSV